MRLGGQTRVEVDVRIMARHDGNLEQALARKETARGSLLPAERLHRAGAAAAAARRRNSPCCSDTA